jgi:hypothetical protein
MTNKYNNWERLERVIAHTGLSANAFALSIGMQRSENIYHIKRGNFGISDDLAERIVARYPEINSTWLLSGVGEMLINDSANSSVVPFYEKGVEQLLNYCNSNPQLNTYQLPFICDCDVVVRTHTRSMVTPGTAATDLFLKSISPAEMIQGNEYLIVLRDETLWRKIRHVKNEPGKWRLVAYDREQSPDVTVNVDDIRRVWRVIARMSILVS